MFSPKALIATQEYGIDTIENVPDGEYTIWDGMDWVRGSVTHYEDEDGITVRMADRTLIEASEDFLLLNLRHKTFSIKKHTPAQVTGHLEVEPILCYPDDCPVTTFDRYDLGVLAYRMETAELESDHIRIELPESEFTLVKEMRHVLRDTDFEDVFEGGKRVFLVYEPELYNLRNYGPDWFLTSTEAGRGYLRCLFDDAQSWHANLRVKSPYIDYLHKVMKFHRVRTDLGYNYLTLPNKEFYRFFMQIGTLSERKVRQYILVWDGERDRIERQTVQVKKVYDEGKVSAEILTESGFICIQGFIGTADGNYVDQNADEGRGEVQEY